MGVLWVVLALLSFGSLFGHWHRNAVTAQEFAAAGDAEALQKAGQAYESAKSWRAVRLVAGVVFVWLAVGHFHDDGLTSGGRAVFNVLGWLTAALWLTTKVFFKKGTARRQRLNIELLVAAFAFWAVAYFVHSNGTSLRNNTGSGSVSTVGCIITSAGNKVCGNDAVAWCQLAETQYQTQQGDGLPLTAAEKETIASCNDIEGI